MRVGKDIIPYKPIASRIRSKSLKQGIVLNEIQEHVKSQIESPVVDNEYMDFLNTLLTQKDITPSSNKALSTSSGSSIIRMVKDSPDSPDTVLPGSTSASSCLIVEQDEPVSLQESSQPCVLLDSASSSVFENENVIQALPGFSTVINDDVQVSKMLCFYL